MANELESIDWSRLVIVAAAHGEKCVGLVPSTEADPKKYIEGKAAERLPVTLHEVRVLLTHASPLVDADGNLVGLKTDTLLTCIDMMTAPMPSYSFVASSWYFPGDFDDVKKVVSGLLRQAVEVEARLSAQNAGIDTGLLRRAPTPNPRRIIQ